MLEIGIIIVSLIISYQSRKIYKLIQEKRYNFFAWAFLSVAISFVFKIISNLTIVHRFYIQNVNFVAVIAREFQEMQIIQFFSFILYKVLFITGLLTLFFITTKTEDKEKIFLYIYFGIIAIFLSIYVNFIFHLTVAIILLFLTEYFYHNYKKFKTRNSYLVFLAFLVITISQILFIFSDLNPFIYLLDEILLLSGFIIFLINQFLIKDEKKNKIRSHKRFFAGFKRR